MPIYEYQCQSCQHEFESLQKMSDPALVDCPACHQPKLRKKISAAGFRLAGSGWYETDFKKSGSKKNLVGEGGGTSETKAGETKADSKPESSPKNDSAKTASTPAASSDK